MPNRSPMLRRARPRASVHLNLNLHLHLNPLRLPQTRPRILKKSSFHPDTFLSANSLRLCAFA
jgi:hypothetical protein